MSTVLKERLSERATLREGALSTRGQALRYVSIDLTPPLLRGLTRAEREIVGLLEEELDNATIAARRGTSIHTVHNQIASVFHKLGVGSRFELAELMARLAVHAAGDEQSDDR